MLPKPGCVVRLLFLRNVNPVVRMLAPRFTGRMTEDTARENHHGDRRDDDPTTDPSGFGDEMTSDEYEQVDLSGTDDRGVEGTDPDLTVPGASDTEESGGQGADDRYVGGELGGGAIGAEIDEDETEGDEA